MRVVLFVNVALIIHVEIAQERIENTGTRCATLVAVLAMRVVVLFVKISIRVINVERKDAPFAILRYSITTHRHFINFSMATALYAVIAPNLILPILHRLLKKVRYKHKTNRKRKKSPQQKKYHTKTSRKKGKDNENQEKEKRRRNLKAERKKLKKGRESKNRKNRTTGKKKGNEREKGNERRKEKKKKKKKENAKRKRKEKRKG